MARIAGVNIPTDKRIEVGLTYVFGIGPSTSRKLLGSTGVDPNTKVKDLTEDEVVKLREAVESQSVEGDLRRERHGIHTNTITGKPVTLPRVRSNCS